MHNIHVSHWNYPGGWGGVSGGLAGRLLCRGWDNEASVQNTYPCAISDPGQWNRSAQVVEDMLIKRKKENTTFKLVQWIKNINMKAETQFGSCFWTQTIITYNTSKYI